MGQTASISPVAVSEANSEPVSESLQVARSAGIASIATLISRVTGLIREVFMAGVFGAGYVNDAFLLGFRIPNLTRDLFAEGALASAFIPTFTATWKTDGREEAARFANVVFTAILAIVGSLCVVGMLFAPQFVAVMAPGFEGVPGKFDLTVRLTRIMFPFLLFIAVAAQVSGMLNSAGRFGVTGVASVFFNVGSILVGLVLGFWVGPSLGLSHIVGMAFGVTAGGLLQMAWQVPWLHRTGFRLRLDFHWSHPGLRQVYLLMLPAAVTAIAGQLNVVIQSMFASSVTDPLRGANGPVSWLSYAFRLVHLPLGVFGIALASAMLPSISRSAAAKNLEEFRKTVAHSLGLVLLLTLPSTLVLAILAKPLIGAVYQGGAFGIYDTQQTALALLLYSIGLAAHAAARMLWSAFYALSDAQTPMYVSLLGVAINVAIPLALIRMWHFGFASLAIASSAAVTVECLLLSELLRRRLGGIEGRYLFDRVKRILAACVLVAAPTSAVYRLSTNYTDSDRMGYIFQLAMCLPVTLIALWIGLRMFEAHDLDVLRQMFVRPLRAFVNQLH